MEKMDRDSVQSVTRALDILDVLSENKDYMGVTQIAKSTGLSKTTAFRLLNTMIKSGYVQKSSEGSEYQLGIKLLKISSSILERQDIRTVAKPFLKKLADNTKEIVHLAILDMNEVVYIDKMESDEHTMRIFSTIGRRSPLHCTGLGKVFMSGLKSEEIETLVIQRGLTKYTEHTITNLWDLKKELELIRERGYAFDEMEHEIGVWCVAAPIFDRNGRMVAAISVTAPEIYLSEKKKASHTSAILSIAKDISYQLGSIK